MRILQAVQALPPHTYGGSELYTADIAEALDGRGHEVAVATPHGGATLDVPTVDLPVPEAPDVQADRGLPTGPVDPAVDRRFEEVIDAVEPDVVHLQHFKGLSATVPALCAARGVACVATLHDFWAICHREQLYRPEGRRCAGPDSVEKCAECLLLAGGGPRADDGGATDPSALEHVNRAHPARDAPAVRAHYRAIVAQRATHLSRALARTDRLVSPSAFLRDRFVAYGTPPGDVVVLRNGIRVDRFEDTGFDGPPVRVGYAGRVAPEKGVHLLLEAFDRLDAGTLEVFGRFAPAATPYHARLAGRAGERVRFPGRYDDPAAPYRAMDVLVLPSVWDENSPLVVQEAHAAGVPVVAADVGGVAELVADGVDGLLFPPADVDALASRLDRLLADPDLIDRLRAGVGTPTRLADHAADLEALYADCAAG